MPPVVEIDGLSAEERDLLLEGDFESFFRSRRVDYAKLHLALLGMSPRAANRYNFGLARIQTELERGFRHSFPAPATSLNIRVEAEVRALPDDALLELVAALGLAPANTTNSERARLQLSAGDAAGVNDERDA